MNQKYLIYIALVLFVVGIIWFSKTNEKESWNKVSKTIVDNEFNGIVLKKYIDNENHNDPIAILSSKQKINLWSFYEKVEVGDSLSKPKGTTVMKVYRNGKIQSLDFNVEIEKRAEKTSR